MNGPAPGASPRVSHKPYPSGRATHSAIEGTLALQRLHNFAVEEVGTIQIDVPSMINHLCARPLIPDPTPNYIRLCIPFQIASALVDGFVDLTTVRHDRLTAPLIREHAAKVAIAVNDTPDPNAFQSPDGHRQAHGRESPLPYRRRTARFSRRAAQPNPAPSKVQGLCGTRRRGMGCRTNRAGDQPGGPIGGH